MTRDDLTSSERATYQALVARGVSPADAREAALDGVDVETSRALVRNGFTSGDHVRWTGASDRIYCGVIDKVHPDGHAMVILDGSFRLMWAHTENLERLR